MCASVCGGGYVCEWVDVTGPRGGCVCICVGESLEQVAAEVKKKV